MITRVKARVEGRVQGVGFRPAVYRHALACGVAGFVRNDPRGVTVDVEGEESAVAAFFADLAANAPGRSEIVRVTRRRLPPKGYRCFTVDASDTRGDVRVHLPPDLAVCEACLREMRDPADRRYRYPFINCVDCGPRFTIVTALPYDRANTSMNGFTMCDECAAEYHDPSDRRFHAQPIACPVCGPRLKLLDPSGLQGPTDDAALARAWEIIGEGGIVAVKGLGGFHLACDALDERAVARLRERKTRPDQAVAVMFRDLRELQTRLPVSQTEAVELLSGAAPIVVVDGNLGEGISPDTGTTGVFLPYTPLHHLLLEPFSALVMTSANRRDEPLALDDAEVSALLGPVADAVLTHDRPIVRRCDDPVVRMAGSRRRFLRRARGFVPEPVRIGAGSPVVLAVGAELKSTFCLVSHGEAYVSQHIGELRDHKTYVHFGEEITRWKETLGLEPLAVAHDLHPAYLSTRYAHECGAPEIFGVQHHHAHVASVMAECGLVGLVLGVALDGTGYGPDGTIWGGEFLLADRRDYRRVARFKPYPLPGGDAAVVEPWRMALSIAVEEDLPWRPDRREASRSSAVERLLRSGPGCPLTSSAGRLFDGAAAMLGLCDRAGYEAQAAIRLEAVADPSERGGYPHALDRGKTPWALDFGPAFQDMAEAVVCGAAVAQTAGRFQNTVVAGVAETCLTLCDEYGIGDVVLSGGVFQNRTVLEGLDRALHDAGLAVHSNAAVPANDGGVSLGQAAVACSRMEAAACV